jgi:hypothetical protein
MSEINQTVRTCDECGKSEVKERSWADNFTGWFKIITDETAVDGKVEVKFYCCKDCLLSGVRGL